MRLMMCAALIAVLAIPAAADDRKDIEALCDKLTKLILSNNLDGTLALETPDFKSKGRDGKILNGKQLVAQMKAEGAMMKLKKFDIKVTKCAVKGNKAEIETSFTGMSEMADPSGKGKHVMTMAGLMGNKLTKTAGGWKFSYIEDKPGAKMTMDGKPFDPSMMGGAPPPSRKGK